MISLRAYNRQIEQLIDSGQYDQAITHCRYLLTQYPKYIEAYRNLGKCLLEQKKYPEAMDIFLRILGVFPDDFISHVGLSIINEEKQNIDTSIWHMEQAFDVQPANLAIQDELKRLFQIRDGEKPQKIRLTRGALVRMYSRGELYQQAISEIQSVLSVDPKRIDLEVILAQMHFLSGDKNECKKICQSLVDRIPFCYEANLILYQIYLDENNIEGSTICRKRLITIDPYFEFAQSPFTTQEIADEHILIELYDPGKGVESFQTSQVWTEPDSQQDDILSITDAPLNGQLSGISPDNTLISINRSVLPEGTISKTDSSAYATNETDESTLEDLSLLFSEMKEGKMDEMNNGEKDNFSEQSIPADWLSKEKTNDNTEVNSDQDLPDWLKNLDSETTQPSDKADDLPDWLRNLQTDIEPQEQTITDNAAFDISNQATAVAETNEAESSFMDRISDPTFENPANLDNGWEKIDLTLDQEQSSETTVDSVIESGSDASEDTVPDWVKSVLLTNPSLNAETDEHAAKTGPLPSFDLADRINDPGQEVDLNEQTTERVSATVESLDQGAISQQTNDELLDWLRGLKEEEKFSSTSIQTPQAEEIISPQKEEAVADGFNELEESIQDWQPLESLEMDKDSNAHSIFESEDQLDGSPTQEVETLPSEKIDSEEVVTETLEPHVFSEMEGLVNKLIDDGEDLDLAIERVTSQQQMNENNFEYWQAIGDLYVKHDRLADALSAYEKAESLLVQSLAS